MKKFITIFAASLALTTLVVTSGCKKEKCYHCEKNPGSPTDHAEWDVCSEDEHDRAVSMGYVCTEKP